MVEPTLRARRMHPTDVGSMFSTQEQVYTYILKMACKLKSFSYQQQNLVSCLIRRMLFQTYLCVKFALSKDITNKNAHEYSQHEEVIIPLLHDPMGMGTAGYEWADQIRHCLQAHQSTLCLK